jgi:hypothetical protein
MLIRLTMSLINNTQRLLKKIVRVMILNFEAKFLKRNHSQNLTNLHKFYKTRKMIMILNLGLKRIIS